MPPRLVDRRLADQRRRQSCRARFEQRTDLHVFADLGGRERGHDDATVALEGDQTLGLEVFQRLANGNLADVEVAGDLVLSQQFAGRQQAIDDRLLQRLRDMIRRAQARHFLRSDQFEG
ncbi:MAG: hypothetical protein AW08_02284 [Candidatus Accumulibacter adjunctus]|uniref:Uncharacterized protein n=1 Tax=Candidatus Accumulibacter adjunctus TaxID=1454001 RepID=A0A011NRE0_9PROT|nr:MAG: hypothetical protein AW08_02284 [Candidatus Accumulibacter adjunctus]